MSMNDKLSVGIIGLGHWGPNIVRCFSNHPKVDLCYVCDINNETFNRVAKIIPEK